MLVFIKISQDDLFKDYIVFFSNSLSDVSSREQELKLSSRLVQFRLICWVSCTEELPNQLTGRSEHNSMAVVLLAGVWVNQNEIRETIVEIKPTKFLVMLNTIPLEESSRCLQRRLFKEHSAKRVFPAAWSASSNSLAENALVVIALRPQPFAHFRLVSRQIMVRIFCRVYPSPSKRFDLRQERRAHHLIVVLRIPWTLIRLLSEKVQVGRLRRNIDVCYLLNR